MWGRIFLRCILWGLAAFAAYVAAALAGAYPLCPILALAFPILHYFDLAGLDGGLVFPLAALLGARDFGAYMDRLSRWKAPLFTLQFTLFLFLPATYVPLLATVALEAYLFWRTFADVGVRRAGILALLVGIVALLFVLPSTLSFFDEALWWAIKVCPSL